jgi:hypothetical protein
MTKNELSSEESRIKRFWLNTLSNAFERLRRYDKNHFETKNCYLKCLCLNLFVLVAVLPSKASTENGDFCRPLISFLKSVQPNEKAQLDFHTSWGQGFRDSASSGAFFAKRCKHYGYEPAKSFCSYLLKEGAVEFSDRNFKRALSCLSSKTQLDSRISFSNASISTHYGTENKGSLVEIEYKEDKKIGGMVLRVIVEGY